MRKIYTFIASIAMAMVSVVAHADGYEFSLPADNTILCGEQYHMRLYKTWDFIALTNNGKPITPETFNTGAEDATMQPCDGYKPVIVTNEGMEGWYMGIGNIEFNKSKGGLYNNKNGIRYVILTGLKKGQIVCIQNGAAAEKLAERIYSADGTTYEDVKIHDYAVNACRIQKESPDGKMPAWTISYLSNHDKEDVVMEITDSIHSAQEALPLPEGEGSTEGNEGTDQEPKPNPNVDAFRYFRVVVDGPLYIAMGKTASIQGLQIWIDANAEESVSTPSYRLKGVRGDMRDIELTCGESTFEEKCHVLYGFPEEEGYTEPEEEYDGEGLSVSHDEDYNEDGKVTVEAVTVSATGAKSEPVRFEIEVGEIVLNAPVLTLIGFNEEYRTYKIEWTSNTLEDVETKFVISGDDDNLFIEDATVGYEFSVKKNAKVTATAVGYTENATTIEVDYPGVVIARKNAAAEGHDVDFTQPSDETKAKLKGEFVESCYIEVDGDKKYYTAEEFQAGTAFDNTDLENATPVYLNSGWSWDGASNRMRATLNVVKDSVLEGNTYTYTYHYSDGLKLVLPEGLSLDCPPNSKNASQILNYLGNFNLGLTCMSRPTLTFDRSVVKAGEIVIITIGAGGGSNYLTYDAEDNTKPLVQTLVFVAPTDNLLTATLPAPATGFCHILNIDYYTHDALPEDTYDPTAVKEISNTVSEPVVIYNTSGVQVNELQKGINIIKMADGSVRKLIKK